MLDSPGRSNLSFLWSLMTFGTENMTVHTVERNIILRNNIFSLQFWYQRRHQIFIAGKKASSPPTSTRWCIVRTYHIVPLVRHSLVVMFGKLPIFPHNMIWYFWISQQAQCTICFFVLLAGIDLYMKPFQKYYTMVFTSVRNLRGFYDYLLLRQVQVASLANMLAILILTSFVLVFLIQIFLCQHQH